MENLLVPKKAFFTKGVGVHKEELRSFELALRDAGIEKCNLVNVSSIFPPKCQEITKEEGVKLLKPGQVVFCVMSRCATNEPNRRLAASIGCAFPSDTNSYGYISEHHSFGQEEKTAGDYAEDLAAGMLASTLGIEFDEDKAWDEKKEYYKVSDKIIHTSNITQTAVGTPKGFTTVMAAAVFIL